MTRHLRTTITIIFAILGLLFASMPAQASDACTTANCTGIASGHGEDAVIGEPATYDPQGSVVTRCIDKLNGQKSVQLQALLDNSGSTESVLYEIWTYYQNSKFAYKGVAGYKTYEVAGGQVLPVKVANLGKKYVKAGGKNYRYLSVEIRVLDLVTVDATGTLKVGSVYKGAKACGVQLPNGSGE